MERSKSRLEVLKEESNLMDAEKSNVSERNLLVRFNILSMSLEALGSKGNDRFKLGHRIHETKRLVSAQQWKPLFEGRTRTPGGGEQLHLHLTGKKAIASAAGGSAAGGSAAGGSAAGASFGGAAISPSTPRFPKATVSKGDKWLPKLGQSEATKHTLYLALAECMGKLCILLCLRMV
jgi:hypothetical protein